jgi:hypothetical protein
MEFIYDCLVVARTYYGAFYLKPVIQSVIACFPWIGYSRAIGENTFDQ